MDLLFYVAAPLGGFLAGGLSAFRDSHSKIRTRDLLAHRPHLPYLALFYIIISIVSFVPDLRLPPLYRIVALGMIGLESGMWFFSRNLKA